tara:strand:- start:21 stop:320 length:300 start_codon:yes stop_codon:yes gene_type:complete
MANYEPDSPYYATKKFGNYLDVIERRPISASPQDQLMEINATYQYRPDLLASDLYDNPKLWWVFAARNPNTITDPIFDMKIGTRIFLPKQDRLFEDLGL